MGRRSKVASLRDSGSSPVSLARRGCRRRSEHAEGDEGRVRVAREADRLRLEPAGLHRRQEGGRATGATVLDATGSGYENVEPNLKRLAQQGADLIIAHASGYNEAAPTIAQQFKVPVVVWDAKPAP